MKKKQKSDFDDSSNGESSLPALGLLNLSDDVLLMIMSRLNHIDLISLGLTCERLNTVFRDRTLWVNVDLRAKPLKKDDLMDCLNYFIPTTKSIATRGRAGSCVKPPVHFNTLFPLPFLQVLSKTCPKLETLILEQFIIQGSEVKISDFPPTLTQLVIKSCPVFALPKDYSYFHQIHNLLPQLKILNLSYNSWFDGHSLMALSQLPNLEELNLRGCHNLQGCVAYFSLAARFGFKNLKVLDMRDTFIRDSEVCCFDRSPRLTHLYLEHPRVPQRSHRSLVVDDSDDEGPSHKRRRRHLKRGQDSESFGSVIVVGLTNVPHGQPCFEFVPVNQHQEALNLIRLNQEQRGLKIAICDNSISFAYQNERPENRQGSSSSNSNATQDTNQPGPSRTQEVEQRRNIFNPSPSSFQVIDLTPQICTTTPPSEPKPGSSKEIDINNTINNASENSKCKTDNLKTKNNKSDLKNSVKDSNEPGPSGLSKKDLNSVSDGTNKKILVEDSQQPGPSGEQKVSSKRKFESLTRIISPESSFASDQDSDTDFMSSDEEDFAGFPDERPYCLTRNSENIEHDDCLLVSDLSIINFCPRLAPEEDEQNSTLFFIRICAGPDLRREHQCKLHTLTLRHFKGISDRSLLHLAKVESLRYLDVTGTSVTKQGVERFMLVRPEVELISNFYE